MSSKLRVPSRSCTGLYVAIHGIGGERADVHVNMADSVTEINIIERRVCRSRVI